MSEIMVFLTKEDLELLFSMVQAKTANTYNILYTMESIPGNIKDEFIRLKKLEAQLVAYKELAEFEFLNRSFGIDVKVISTNYLSFWGLYFRSLRFI